MATVVGYIDIALTEDKQAMQSHRRMGTDMLYAVDGATVAKIGPQVEKQKKGKKRYTAINIPGTKREK